MKIAVLVCGETRTWDEEDVEKNKHVPGRYTSCADGWQKLSQEFDIDFYGITWKHCKPPKNLNFFKYIKFLDFYGDQYRNNIQTQTCEFLKRVNNISDAEYAWNTIAQYYQWIDGFKFVYSKNNYDYVIKVRWDLVPCDFAEFIHTLKQRPMDQECCYLGVDSLAITYQNPNKKFVSCSDMVFVVNKKLYQERFSKNPTDQILYEHITSNPPSGFGNYDLFFPDKFNMMNKAETIVPKTACYRIIAKGFRDYGNMDDRQKNFSTTIRPPT